MKCDNVNLLRSKILFGLSIIFQMFLGVMNLPAESTGTSMYAKRGFDWPGICNTGFRQSPINIIEGSNTEPDSSYIEVDYHLPSGAPDKKLFFDGDRLYMDINLGNITFFNKAGAKEIYDCEKIELHFPSEHYVTRNGQTPRYALELQIYHSIKKSDNFLITNEKIKVTKAVLSILFTVGDLEEGDIFLNQLGISKYNTDDTGKFLITSPNNYITRKKVIPATYGVGFNYLAFQGLLNLINADRHLFFYYGSETTPPCREEVLWMVFAEPRSLSRPQFDFLLLLLSKNKEEGKTITEARTPAELYGNKRAIFLYDENMRGKILSNPVAVRKVKRRAYFRTKESK